MNFKNFFLILVSLLMISACSNDYDHPVSGSGIPQQTDNPPAVDRGKNLFETKCANCHGADGTAGISNAANLRASMMDSASIVQIMINGKGAMPSFKDRFTEEELHKLASYIFSLRK